MFKDLSLEEVKQQFSPHHLLIVTANDVEAKLLNESLTPIKKYGRIIRTTAGKQTYFIGILGHYLVVHVKCTTMGSILPSASTNTIAESIDEWGPRAIIMVGIAMGLNPKHKIGDVLVSSTLSPYEPRRVGQSQSINRNHKVPSGPVLLNRFNNAVEWQESNVYQVYPGEILSGEKLVDNVQYKQQIIDEFPEAIGLEMEGAGLYSACTSKSVAEWIIVKGISDYGDGNKKRNKKKNQLLAVQNAISLCELVLSNPYSFASLNIFPFAQSDSQLIENYKFGKVKAVLFDVYNNESESYYVLREEDKRFVNALKFGNNIWIHGHSGVGKTVCILRNLSVPDKKFCFITLGSCIGDNSAEGLLIEILSKLNEINRSPNAGKNNDGKALIQDCTDAICKLKIKDEYYIFIEEIPLDNNSDENFEKFAQAIFAIGIGVNYKLPNAKIKFILSSISNPLEKLKPSQEKIKEQFISLFFDSWQMKDIDELLALICRSLGIVELDDDAKAEIKSKCDGNPRKIKLFFREYLLERSYTSKTDYQKVLAKL